MEISKETIEFINGMVDKGRKAMESIEELTQEDVCKIGKSIAFLGDQRAEVWAKALYDENGNSGRYESKLASNTTRPLGIASQIDNAKTVGVIEEDPDGYLIKIAKPLGVLGSLVPMTVPTGVVIFQSIFSLMAKNAIIFSPHPRTKKVTNFVVDNIRELLDRMGYPKDLVQCIDSPSKDMTNELMNQVDFVVATGGDAMVKAAYSSGTPAFGVGAGNSISVVDDTADLDEVANGIMLAQTNDWGAGCSTENSALILESVYDETIEKLKEYGGYLCTEKEKEKLVNTLWKDGHLNVDCIMHSPQHIAKVAEFDVAEDRKFIMTEEENWGKGYPMTGEKLAPVIAVWKAKNLDEAIELVNNIHSISGAGHSCSIHSKNEDNILKFASNTKTSRVAVNTNTALNNAGSHSNNMPWTFSLGCGSWGGNAYSENNTFKHYYNTTWVYRTVPGKEAPSKEEVFGDLMNDDKLFSDYPKFQK